MPMSITDWVCGSCACVGIKDLGRSANAKAAMRTFCRLCLLAAANRYKSASAYKELESFYVFIAGPEEPGHYHSKPWVKYGTEFAELIEKNKLGTLVTPGKAVNTKHHSGEKTTCQTWLWMPDRDALIAWWEANKPPEMSKEDKAALNGYEVYLGSWVNTSSHALSHTTCAHCSEKLVEDKAYYVSEIGAYMCKTYGQIVERTINEDRA